MPSPLTPSTRRKPAPTNADALYNEVGLRRRGEVVGEIAHLREAGRPDREIAIGPAPLKNEIALHQMHIAVNADLEIGGAIAINVAPNDMLGEAQLAGVT